MFTNANELKQNLFERGYLQGKFDAEQQCDHQITIRMQAAKHIARYDAWSQGYITGYDDRTKELSLLSEPTTIVIK